MSRAESLRGGLFPAIEELIPHRSPVVLLDRVVFHAADYTEAIVAVARQRWLTRDDGSVAGWLAVEYMAQCVAVHEGLLALEEGRPPPSGFLVGITNLRLEVADFAADEMLRVRAQRVRGRPSLGALSHHCSVFREASGDAPGALLAKGRLSVSVPRD